MEFRQLIREIRDLNVYTSEQWVEYLGCFEDEGLGRFLDGSLVNRYGLLVERIVSGAGAPPVAANPALPGLIRPEGLASRRQDGGGTIGMVSGCFDLLHLGHVRGMRYAKEFLNEHGRGELYALTMTDENIRAKKGSGRPIMNLGERLTMMAAVRYVDRVAVLLQPNCLVAIRALRPDYFFKSKADRRQGIVSEEMRLVESLGGAVVLFPEAECPGKSTTQVIESIRAGKGNVPYGK